MDYFNVNLCPKDNIMTEKKTEELLIEDQDNPCKLICSMEKESGFCFGCGRTQDEISYWHEMSYDKKQSILSILPSRMPPLIKLRAERRAKRRVNKRKKPSI
jgi:predicted Fe-S protein YdhL (DUF1289 family)